MTEEDEARCSAETVRPPVPVVASTAVTAAPVSPLAPTSRPTPPPTRRAAPGFVDDSQKDPFERAFDDALEGLTVELDPMVDTVSRTVMGFSPQMRSSEEGLATEAVLVATAERLGRLPELRQRARDLAVTTFASMPSDTLLFLDVDSRELAEGELYSPSVEMAALAPRIVLQVRAGTFDASTIGARASVLRFIGFRFAIAGFDGESTPATLASLAPEFVKIDARMVRDVNGSVTRRRVVKVLVTMARALDAVAVADGVSTAEERDALVDAGCSFVQGPLVVHRKRTSSGGPALRRAAH